MRVILFHQFFLGKEDSGGSRWNELVNYFSSNNVKIDVIAGSIHYATGKPMGKKGFFTSEKIDDNITLYRTWTYSGYNANFLGRLIGYFSYTFSSLIKSLILKKPDIIIVTSPPLFVGISALILSKIKRVPFIFEVRDLWPESAIATGVLNNKFLIKLMYSLEKILYKNSKKIVILTPAFKDDIINRFPNFKDKIEIITNGADFNLINKNNSRDTIRDRYGWMDKKIFAYFGTHGVANDLMQIVEVARFYKNNDTIRFVLIGDGMQKALLKKKSKEYGLDNIEFIDSIPKYKVYDYISASDICMAILKKTDTFKTVYPNKVFDYMSCQKPVLVTIDGITRKLIENSGCGLYSPPSDVKLFKETVDKFINLSTEELDKMGINGYKYVKKYFDRAMLSKKYLEILREVR